MIEKEVVKKANGKVFCRLKIKRITTGIELYIKAPELEKFFKAFGNLDLISPDLSVYYLQKNTPEILSQVSIDCIYHDGGGLNTGFLQVEGIKKGKKFQLNGVMSKQMIENYLRDLNNTIKTLYINYIKPFEFDYEISIRDLK